MNVLALDGAYNGANVRIRDDAKIGDLIVVGQADEAETYRLERWVDSSDELVLMTVGGRFRAEFDAEVEVEQFTERMSMA